MGELAHEYSTPIFLERNLFHEGTRSSGQLCSVTSKAVTLCEPLFSHTVGCFGEQQNPPVQIWMDLARLGETPARFAQLSFQGTVTKDKHSKVQGHEPIGLCGQHVLGPVKNDNKQSTTVTGSEVQYPEAREHGSKQKQLAELRIPSRSPLRCHTSCQRCHRAALVTKGHSFCSVLQRDFLFK